MMSRSADSNLPRHKRAAEDDVTTEQRLSKRFHLLNIGSQSSGEFHIYLVLMIVD